MKTGKYGKSIGMVAVPLMLMSNVGAASTTELVVSGITCMPTSLQQAIGKIAWNHMRVHNVSTKQLWVTCSVPNTVEYYGTEARSLNYGNFAIRAWFGDNATIGSQIFCVAREVQGTGTLTTGQITTVTSTATAIPQDKNANVSGSGFSTGYPVTMTCRLDPGTGIQGIGTDLAPAP